MLQQRQVSLQYIRVRNVTTETGNITISQGQKCDNTNRKDYNMLGLEMKHHKQVTLQYLKVRNEKPQTGNITISQGKK